MFYFQDLSADQRHRKWKITGELHRKRWWQLAAMVGSEGKKVVHSGFLVALTQFGLPRKLSRGSSLRIHFLSFGIGGFVIG
jgi:hypothetical protein